MGAKRGVCVGLVAGAVLAGAGTGSAAAPPVTLTPHVSLEPATVVLGGRASLLVAGWREAHLEVSLSGATDRAGRLLGWRVARRQGQAWVVELPRPALRGIYPVLLRERAGAPVTRSTHWLLRIFRPQAAHEPTFTTPQAAVRWWVQSSRHATVAAMKQWRRSDLDKRDPKLHRLFVVAFNLRGRPGVANRLGRFVTAVRDGYHGPWRLLEANVQP
ncbi:MAG TPA: hypothetical protein VHQ89_07420 [Gaiellaceae bacterium]|jgi:hypothetical protein|nr:hypothetical protein [Gaiellaceae bacterium]